MIESVYNYLREFGFSKEEVNYFEFENEEMFFTNLKEINKNINFLISKGLNKEEIINLIKDNPYMLTVKDNRLKALDKIYLDILSLNNIELKNLIINNCDTYIESPVEIEKIIDYMVSKGCNKDMIKDIILNSPSILDMTLDKFKGMFEKETK